MNALGPIKSVADPFFQPLAAVVPGHAAPAREDRAEVDPEAYAAEEPVPLDLEELKANQGAVTQTVGVAHKTEELVRASQGQAPDTGSTAAVSRNVGRAAGPVSTVLGARDAAEGVREMQEGKVVEGGLKTSQGATSSASGAATMVKTWAPLAKSSASLQGAASVAGKVAGPLGAVGAGIDSATDLNEGLDVSRRGVEVKNPEKVATGATKAAAAGLMAAGLACPPAGLAGAALYAGTTLYENREAIGDGLKKAGGAVARGAEKAGGAVADGVKKVASFLK